MEDFQRMRGCPVEDFQRSCVHRRNNRQFHSNKMSSTLDLAALTIGDVIVSGKGSKTAPLSYNGESIVWLPDRQQIAFEARAFGNEDVARVNLVFQASASAIDQLTALDEQIVILATANSLKLFGKVLSEAEVLMRYSPALKHSEKFPATFKCKINLSGRGEVRIWDTEKNTRAAPASWIQCAAVPKLTLRNVWMMGKEFGITFDATDLLLTEASAECPF